MSVVILQWVLLILVAVIGLHTLVRKIHNLYDQDHRIFACRHNTQMGRSGLIQARKARRELVPLHVDLHEGLMGQDEHV